MKTLDCNVLNNYRPVSSSTLISKLWKRTIYFLQNAYLFNNNLIKSRQSVHQSSNRTEISQYEYYAFSVAFFTLWNRMARGFKGAPIREKLLQLFLNLTRSRLLSPISNSERSNFQLCFTYILFAVSLHSFVMIMSNF